MGQAKRRGTYEERKEKAEAIQKAKFEEYQRKRKELQRLADEEADRQDALLTPEERRKQKSTNNRLNMFMAYTIAAAMMSMPLRRM